MRNTPLFSLLPCPLWPGVLATGSYQRAKPNYTELLETELYICSKRNLALITKNGWCTIKPNQSKSIPIFTCREKHCSQSHYNIKIYFFALNKIHFWVLICKWNKNIMFQISKWGELVLGINVIASYIYIRVWVLGNPCFFIAYFVCLWYLQNHSGWGKRTQ